MAVSFRVMFKSRALPWCLLGVSLFYAEIGVARFIVTPELTARELATSNIALRPAPFEQPEWVTEVAPSLALTQKGPRYSLLGMVRLQGLYYAHHRHPHKFYQQFLLNSQTFFLRKKGKIELMADHSQQTLFPTREVAVDNIRGSQQTNVSRFKIGPDYEHPISRWFTSSWMYRYGRVFYHQTPHAQPSDHQAQWTLKTDKRKKFDFIHELDWHQTSQQGVRMTENFSEKGTLRYRFAKKMRAYGVYGYEHNQGKTSSNEIEGSLWFVGLQYFPTKRLLLDVRAGERAYGKSYEAKASWFKKHQNFSLLYRELIVNYYQEKLQQLNGSRALALGASALQFQPEMRQDLFIKKNLAGQWLIQGARSFVSIQPFYEKRLAANANLKERAHGLNGEIGWKRNSKWHYGVSGGFSRQWLINEVQDKRWQIEAKAEQALGSKTKLLYQVHHFELERSLYGKVRENTVSLALNWQG